ncbi:MAG: hypothetical protein HY885_18505 [Deltaproteobacteria bacterium]|nr:hypothetical protein [Deltaproteobacteria bacterium]
MRIHLNINADSEAAGCGNWREVDNVLRVWAAVYAGAVPEVVRSAAKGGGQVVFDLQTADIVSAIMQLHAKLYDLQVNFTASVD